MQQRVKEHVRYWIGALGLSGLYNRYRYALGHNVVHLLQPSRAASFATVYEKGLWLSDDANGSRSGLGSEIKNTRSVRDHLPLLLAELGVKRLLDVGCGDWNWMRHVNLECDYIGADIVPSVIEKNIHDFARPGVQFVVLDGVAQALPACDAVLCREVVFHLPFADAHKLLRNVRRSAATYLLITSEDKVAINFDVVAGDFRPLDLRKAPFHFPAPMKTIADDSVNSTRYIGVWRVADLHLGD